MDTFIKTRMNSGVGQRKTERAKKIIQESHIICIFGMSMGNTDKIWWEEIIEWLVVNANNKLIIFWKGYEDALKRRLPAKLIRINEEIRRRLFDKGKGKYTEKEYIAIKERIIISYNSDIFSLPKISD